MTRTHLLGVQLRTIFRTTKRCTFSQVFSLFGCDGKSPAFAPKRRLRSCLHHTIPRIISALSVQSHFLSLNLKTAWRDKENPISGMSMQILSTGEPSWPSKHPVLSSKRPVSSSVLLQSCRNPHPRDSRLLSSRPCRFRNRNHG